MKNMVVALALVVGLMASAYAQDDGGGSSTTGETITVNAKLTRGLSMSLIGGNATLDFGTITLPATSPTINPTDQGAVKLQIVGDDNEPVSFSYPSTVSLSNGSANLTFTPTVQGNTSQNGTPSSVNGHSTLSSSGSFYLWVGGALPSSIPTTQATGQYTGQFQITVNHYGS